MKRMYPLVLDIVKHFQTNDPNEICEMMGIRVRRQHLLDGRGFYIKNPWLRIIVLDDRLSLNMADMNWAIYFCIIQEKGFIFMTQRIIRIIAGKSTKRTNSLSCSSPIRVCGTAH